MLYGWFFIFFNRQTAARSKTCYTHNRILEKTLAYSSHFCGCWNLGPLSTLFYPLLPLSIIPIRTNWWCFWLKLNVLFISCIIWIRAMRHRIVLWSHKRQKFILTVQPPSLNSFVGGRNGGFGRRTSGRNVTLLITIIGLESDHRAVLFQLTNIRGLHEKRLGSRHGLPSIRLLAFWSSVSWNCSFAVTFRNGRPAKKWVRCK